MEMVTSTRALQIWEGRTPQLISISKVKGVFDEGYIRTWSEEHLLGKGHKSTPPLVSKIRDKVPISSKGLLMQKRFNRSARIGT